MKTYYVCPTEQKLPWWYPTKFLETRDKSRKKKFIRRITENN